MTVSGLLRSLDPGRKFRDFLIIHDECELERQRNERIDIQQVSHGKQPGRLRPAQS